MAPVMHTCDKSHIYQVPYLFSCLNVTVDDLNNIAKAPNSYRLSELLPVCLAPNICLFYTCARHDNCKNELMLFFKDVATNVSTNIIQFV